MKLKKQQKIYTKRKPSKWTKRGTIQNSIPFEFIEDNGVCDLGDNQYSCTYQFTDINYIGTSNETRITIFEKYCEFLNSLNEDIFLQIHIMQKPMEKMEYKIFIDENKAKTEEQRKAIKEYNYIQTQRMYGVNSYIQEKFITLKINADSEEKANRRFLQIEKDSIIFLSKTGSKINRVNRFKRIEMLREIYLPNAKSSLSEIFKPIYGMYDKEYIAPNSFETSRTYIKMGDIYQRVLFLTDFPTEISDETIKNLIDDLNENILVTINVQPIRQADAIEIVKTKLINIDKSIGNMAEKQRKQGSASVIIPRETKRAISNLEKLYEELETRNEKMFKTNILILIQAKTLDKLDEIEDSLKNKAGSCSLSHFAVSHEDAFNSVLPLGRNDTYIARTLTTSAVAGFSPFNVLDIIDETGLVCGINKASNNLIVIDRKNLTNPHGFTFGVSGGGKSMGNKWEIFETFFKTKDDIIILDPEGEFVKITNLLGGLVINLSGTNQMVLNPFDINENYGREGDASPIPFKSDFIISFIDETIGRKYGLSAIDKSIIDKCVREIYQKYLKKPKKKNIPTYQDFYDELKKQNSFEAETMVKELELFVEGSLNLFNKEKAEINLDNRLICINLKDLPIQLKNPAYKVAQDFIWNRVSLNKQRNVYTRLWNDEIHLALKTEISADWLCTSWKIGRKYGLIATGMTQEVKDAIKVEDARALIANSEFVTIYRQKDDTLKDISSVVILNDNQKQLLKGVDAGCGLIKAGNDIIEFTNKIDSEIAPTLYNVLMTNIQEKKVDTNE